MFNLPKNLEYIFFDFDNVLAVRSINRSSYLSKLLHVDAMAIREHYMTGFLNSIELSSLYFAMSNVDDEIAFYKRLFAEFCRYAHDDEIYQRSAEWFVSVPFVPNHEAIAALKDASKNYRIGVLSNGTPSRANEIKALGLDCIEQSIVSYESGVEKPSTEAYLKAAKKIGLPPERIGLIDDSVDNLHGAEDAGFCYAKAPSSELWASFA